MSISKITMQFGSAQFAAEGTDQFINSMFEKWSDILKGPEIASLKVVEATKVPAGDPAPINAGGSLSSYENVYDELDGKIKVIAHMPGTNKADKTRNTALVVMFGNYLRGQQTTSADEIREHCQDQGCFDQSNFASHLKGLKDKVAMNTKQGGGYDVKLTAPGRKAAQAFVEKLNNET